MQWARARTLAKSVHKSRHRFAIDRPVLILLVTGRGRSHGDQQTIKVVQNTEISRGITAAEDAGMIHQVAEINQASRAGGGSCELDALAAQMERNSGSDIPTTDNSEPPRHSSSSHFTQRNH